MILEDVSKLSGVSISVVSRVCNSKYVETPFGTYPLRWFFSLKAATQKGDDDVSVRKIKALLRQLVEGEDKQKPLNDEKLTQLIAEQGFQIARRTVAKYREQMGIPVARLRK
jgi:RNA polymerase sigma-54 factor